MNTQNTSNRKPRVGGRGGNLGGGGEPAEASGSYFLLAVSDLLDDLFRRRDFCSWISL
ncbi:hypothetical protein DAI22_05g210700 [Oryza sativa Japonica Group]|nr:hypothetical protein DAI22_05g210700 [Oryza sativa Japonica Group]